jgi:predicted Na+-dependent transporter
MSLAAPNVGAINKRLEQLMPVLTPLGIALGFFLPGVFIHLRPFVPWLFGLMTLSGALNLRVNELGSTIRSPVPILVFFVSTHVIMPLCAMLTASLFFGSSPDTVAGFILLFSGPAAVSSFIWVAMFRGDAALCLTLILLDTLLAPLVLPGTVSLLIGAKVTMDMTGIAFSLILMVVIPTIVGVTLNETSRGKIPNIVCPYLAPVAKICLMLVIAANTAPVGKIIRFDDLVVREVAGLCILLSVGGFLLSKLAAIVVRSNPPKSVALFFAGGLRNISAVTTIAVTFFPEATALPALLGIMFQQTLSAIMGKLCINVDAQERNHYDST